MRGIITVFWKDLKGILFNPIFFMVGGCCTAVWGYSFLTGLNRFVTSMRMSAMMGRGQPPPDIHNGFFIQHISLVNLILLLAVPALTMRLIAEEKKLRTYDLLLTSPISATQIVIGKLAAGIGAAWALIALSFLYPAVMYFFTEFDWGPLLSSYLGILLLVAGYVSIGLFCSSFTESVVLAVIAALIFNVALWFLGTGTDIAENPTATAIFEHLSIGTHLVGFIKGSIRLSGIVFFMSIISLYTFLTQRVVESSRWR